jgi:hypothetical protein
VDALVSRGGLGETRLVHVDGGDPCAGVRHALGGEAPHAAAGARDEHHPDCERHVPPVRVGEGAHRSESIQATGCSSSSGAVRSQ